MEHDLISTEQLVDLLQGKVPCFRIEEVDKGKEAEVEDAEIDVSAPSDVGDADRSNLDDEEGKDPYWKRFISYKLDNWTT